jgi:hypothetical protein
VWLGQTSPARPLQGFRLRRGCSTEKSPSPGRPSRGSRASRSAPHGVAASSVRRSLLVVSTTARSSAVRPSVGPGPRGPEPPAAPTGFVAPSGFGPRRPLRSGRTGSPLLGFSPLQRRQRRDPYRAGRPRPATVRPRGFSPPRRVALPAALRTRWVRCRSWGSPREALSDGWAGMRRRSPCAPSPAVPFDLEL